jgi:DNA-binding transcriptional ArsR family regulator
MAGMLVAPARAHIGQESMPDPDFGYLSDRLSICYGPGMPAAEAEVLLDRTFHALADPSRRSIVVRLTRGPASVSELAEPLAMSLPAVVQHLDVLQRSGLVRSEKVGRVRTCRLEPAPMLSVQGWIAQHRATWERRLERLGDVLDATYGDDE